MNYIEHAIVIPTTINGCVFNSLFVSLVGISTGITSSGIGLKICAIIAAIKEYKAIKKKNIKKHGKISLTKSKLNVQ